MSTSSSTKTMTLSLDDYSDNNCIHIIDATYLTFRINYIGQQSDVRNLLPVANLNVVLKSNSAVIHPQTSASLVVGLENYISGIFSALDSNAVEPKVYLEAPNEAHVVIYNNSNCDIKFTCSGYF